MWTRELRSWETDIWSQLSSELIQINSGSGKDELIWMTSKDVYTTNLAYRLMMGEGESQERWGFIWKLKIPPRISIFLWKLEHGILPTRVFILHRLGLNIDGSCAKCGGGCENIVHIFWDCIHAKWAWDFISQWWNVNILINTTTEGWLWSSLNSFRGKFLRQVWGLVLAALYWSLWLSRNQAVFNNQVDPKETLISTIKERINKWCLNLDIISENLLSLWNVNPIGAILLHQKGMSLRIMRDVVEDFVGYCDGSWMVDTNGKIKAGIGGYIIDNMQNTVFVFSGPSKTSNALETEINAARVLIQEFRNSMFKMRPLRMYTDCLEVVNIFYREKFGLSGSNDLKHFVGLNRNVSIFASYIPRRFVLGADSLAREGRERDKILKAWC